MSALKLYANTFNYKKEQVVKRYYQDDEDAYFMVLEGLLKNTPEVLEGEHLSEVAACDD